MLSLRSALLSSLFGLLFFGLSACGPDYPECHSDEHCEAREQYCVDALCQQCRDDSHCSTPGQRCSVSRTCEYTKGYCDAQRPCRGNQKCRDNLCGDECLNNEECQANEFSDSGSCAVKPECGVNADRADCDTGFNCEGGRCVRQITRCTGEPIYFRFNSDKIEKKEIDKLEQIATCLKGNSVAPVQIGGHADDVGSTEYNFELADRRASTVKNYLSRLGVDENLMTTISYGEDRPAVNEAGRQPKNRRAEFN